MVFGLLLSSVNELQMGERATDFGCFHDASSFENLAKTTHLSSQTLATKFDSDDNPDNCCPSEGCHIGRVDHAPEGFVQSL